MSRRLKLALLFLGAVTIMGGIFKTPLLLVTRQTVWSAMVALAGRWQGIDLLDYNATQVNQLAVLRAENIRLKGELQDYVKLRQQLEQPSVIGMRTIQAVVAAAPLDVFRTHLLVNKGVRDGVVLGAPVVTEGSILIGFISNLGEQSAVCRLLYNPESSLPAEVLEIENARGLLTGNLYTSLVLTTIPRDAKLMAGQAVVTVAHGMTPPALVVGTIEQIYNEENEAYQQARLQTSYDIDNLRGVTILVQP